MTIIDIRRPALLAAALLGLSGAVMAQGFLGASRAAPGTVMIELTPTTYQNGRLEVQMSVTTHSANDLDTYDLTKVVTLEVQGKRIAPVAAPKLEGHHNRGQLAFEAPALKSPFSIVISDLHDPGRKVFSW